MRTLIVDNSNTRTKLALADGDCLTSWRAIIPTPEISQQSIADALGELSWDASIISSVVPDKAATLASHLGSKPCHQLNHLSKLPIGINYPQPEQIGADRLANAVGAFAQYGSPCIVLDFGTAVTFDVIAATDDYQRSQPSADDPKGVQAQSDDPKGVQAQSDDPKGVQAQSDDPKGVQAQSDDPKGVQAQSDDPKGVQAQSDDPKGVQAQSDDPKGVHAASYQGGVIAPGLASMTEGLANRTALLPHITLQEPNYVIGKSTEQAMMAGAIYGYRGLVREILNNLSKEFSSKPLVIATGGDAPLITRGLSEIDHLVPDLTLDGLRIIANLNITNP